MEQITAAGGVLFREAEEGTGKEAEVLLIYRNGVWDLPKGKLEQNESIKECAAREVSEEVGCAIPDIHARLTDTYHEYEESGKQIGKTTHWYAMTLTQPEEALSPEKKEGIHRLEWVPVSQAAQQVGYENLEHLLAAFKKWYGDR